MNKPGATIRTLLRSAIDNVVRRLVQTVANELEDKHADSSNALFARVMAEQRALSVRLQTDQLAIDARLTADQLALSRDILRVRTHVLTIDALKLKLDEVARESRSTVAQLESELAEAGAQRSFLLRELNRLTHDLAMHQRECDALTSAAQDKANVPNL